MTAPRQAVTTRDALAIREVGLGRTSGKGYFRSDVAARKDAARALTAFRPDVAARQDAALAAIARSVDLVAASQGLVDRARTSRSPSSLVRPYAYLSAELDDGAASAWVRRDGSMCGHRKWLRIARSSAPEMTGAASDPLWSVLSLSRSCDRLHTLRFLHSGDRGVYPDCHAVASVAGRQPTPSGTGTLTGAVTGDGAQAVMEPETFDSEDVTEVEAFVSKIYSKLHIGAVGETTRAQIRRRVLSPEIGFDDLDYSFDIGYAGQPQNRLIICDVVTNTIRRDSDGDGAQGSDTFGPGHQFLISRPDLPYAGLCHGARLRFTLVDPVLLTRVATSADDPGRPVRVLDHRPVSRRAALQLQRAVAYVRNHVVADSGPAPTPLVVSTASQFIAAHVLQAYANTAAVPPARQDRLDAHTDALHLAIAFIEANPDVDIAVGDIARAAYVTPRAIQLAFRRHLDTTPMAYLRQVRLDCAHQQLREGGDGLTVTAVAYRWGFSSLSRFAALHRAAYGVNPGDTLREGR